MANLTQILRDEIKRVARKVVKSDNALLKRQSAQYRRDVAALKRDAADLQRRVNFLEKRETVRLQKKPAAELAANVRFSPRWLAAHRKKLGISAANYAKLVGVTGLTIYSWEKGTSRPRAQQLAAWVAMRDIGKREAVKRLEMLEQ